MKWIVGGLIAYVVVTGMSEEDTGSSDYKPPSQTQTDQRKCNPDALIDFGCTP